MDIITTQIPKELNEKIKKYKEKTGISIYRVIIKALEEFFKGVKTWD